MQQLTRNPPSPFKERDYALFHLINVIIVPLFSSLAYAFLVTMHPQGLYEAWAEDLDKAWTWNPSRPRSAKNPLRRTLPFPEWVTKTTHYTKQPTRPTQKMAGTVDIFSLSQPAHKAELLLTWDVWLFFQSFLLLWLQCKHYISS